MRSRIIWLFAVILTLGSSSCTSPPSADPPDQDQTGAASPTSEVVESPEPLSYESVIHPNRLGPIEIGMTLREANEVSEANFQVQGFNSQEGARCYYASPDKLQGLQLQMEPSSQPTDPLDGPIVVINIQDPRFRTAKEIHVGSTEQETRDAYPSAKAAPFEYDPNGKVLSIDDGLHFVTDGSKVISIQAGSYRSEGCA